MGITDAETYAILKAIRHITKLTPFNDCQIFTDSQASLYRISSASNYTCHQIRKEAQRLNHNLQWCPGNLGIEGNEIADSLAKGAITKTPLRNDKFTTMSFLKEMTREIIMKTWKDDWHEQVLRQEEGRKAKGLGKYYQIQALTSTPTFSLKPFLYTKFNRKTQAEYIQARTGIGNTRAYNWYWQYKGLSL